MQSGAWYLYETGNGASGGTGALGPAGVCELYRRLTGTGAPADLVLEASGLGRRFDYEVFFGLYNLVKNAGGKVVVVDSTGALANFFFGLSLASPVPVVDSADAARRLLAVYTERGLVGPDTGVTAEVTPARCQEGRPAPRASLTARIARRASWRAHSPRHQPATPAAA